MSCERPSIPFACRPFLSSSVNQIYKEMYKVGLARFLKFLCLLKFSKKMHFIWACLWTLDPCADSLKRWWGIWLLSDTAYVIVTRLHYAGIQFWPRIQLGTIPSRLFRYLKWASLTPKKFPEVWTRITPKSFVSGLFFFFLRSSETSLVWTFWPDTRTWTKLLSEYTKL